LVGRKLLRVSGEENKYISYFGNSFPEKILIL
jgi:hypothetical protein